MWSAPKRSRRSGWTRPAHCIAKISMGSGQLVSSTRIDHLDGKLFIDYLKPLRRQNDHAQDGQAEARAGTGKRVTPLEIVEYPDEILRAQCDPVVHFDGALGRLAWDMVRTMYAAPGRGLAAPQVGVVKRLFVIDVDWKLGRPDPLVFVNPELLSASDEEEVAEEGCLSIPETPCLVARPSAIAVGWQGLDGTGYRGTFEGAVARCILHELDHLDGVLCIDRMVVT